MTDHVCGMLDRRNLHNSETHQPQIPRRTSALLDLPNERRVALPVVIPIGRRNDGEVRHALFEQGSKRIVVGREPFVDRYLHRQISKGFKRLRASELIVSGEE